MLLFLLLLIIMVTLILWNRKRRGRPRRERSEDRPPEAPKRPLPETPKSEPIYDTPSGVDMQYASLAHGPSNYAVDPRSEVFYAELNRDVKQ